MFEKKFNLKLAAFLDEYHEWCDGSDEEKLENLKTFRKKGQSFGETFVQMDETDVFDCMSEISFREAKELTAALIMADLADFASLFNSFYRHHNDLSFKKLWLVP